MHSQADDLVAVLIGETRDHTYQKHGDLITGQADHALGLTTSHSRLFYGERRRHKEHRRRLSQSAIRRDRQLSLDIQTECHRLTQGFSKSVQASGLRGALSGLGSAVSTPDWLRAGNFIYEKLCTTCGACRTAFTLTKKKHYCSVCGMAVCGNCSTRDMILYVPDAASSEQQHDVTWAIIRVVGCPEKEPNVCQNLRICQDCQERLKRYQIEVNVEQLEHQAQDGNVFWAEVIRLEERASAIDRKIKTHLPQYRDLTHILSEGGTSGRSPRLPSGVSHTQILAKIQAKTDMYFDALFAFRHYNSCLASSMPQDVLTSIQNIVDQNALNTCYLLIRQLGLEALIQCSKHHLSQDLPASLAQLEQVSQGELESCITQSGQDWEEHKDAVNRFIQASIKEKPLLRMPRRYMQYYTGEQIELKLWWICDSILRRVQLQLAAKSTDKKFRKTKTCIEETLSATRTKLHSGSV